MDYILGSLRRQMIFVAFVVFALVSIAFLSVRGTSADDGAPQWGPFLSEQADSAKRAEKGALAAEKVPAPLPQDKPNVPAIYLPKTGAIETREMRLYREIYEAQDAAQWGNADELIAQLNDGRLMGYVLAHRYLHPEADKPKAHELESWLSRYQQHAIAEQVYDLAERSYPNQNFPKPKFARLVRGPLDNHAGLGKTYVSERARSKAQKREVARIKRQIVSMSARGRPTQALTTLNEKSSKLDRVEINTLKGRIASGYLYAGEVEKAFDIARKAADESGADAPLAGWVAGLAGWRLKQYRDAAQYFELAARSPYANSWTVSGAAYWAARAHLRVGNFREVSLWLNRAAQFPRTFYGLIALRSLGRQPEFNWRTPAPAADDFLAEYPAGLRGQALIYLGQKKEAERELTVLAAELNRSELRELLAFALEVQLPSLSWRLATILDQQDGSLYDAALYPMMPWAPEEGYRIDRALIHAIARQESRFDPSAGSSQGARGIMQLIPSTAAAMAGDEIFRAAGGAAGLYDPNFNVTIGQTYIERLFDAYSNDRNLFSMSIAWNAGPGNYRRWRRDLSEVDDPLLFIESIPLTETRAFVERMMTNYWIYRTRLGQNTPSLDAVASGDWPIYVAQETPQTLQITTSQ